MRLFDRADMSRQTDIDIAKGIGIILVVWAHANGPYSSYITQFHMPFFFFISGLLYRSSDESCSDYIKRKCRTLLVPFWWWNFLSFPIFYTLYYWGKWSFSTCMKSLVEIAFTLNKVPFLGATWFLPALFWISMLTHICVKKISCHFRYGDLLLLLVGCIASILGFYVTFPYRISRTLICSLFYICGYLYNKHLRYRISTVRKSIIAWLGGILFLIFSNINSVDMGSNTYKSKIAFLIGAFAATAFMLGVSKWLLNITFLRKAKEHLIYLGKNTIDIVIWHFLAFRITIIIQILVMNIDVKSIIAFPVYDASGMWWIVYVVTGIYGSLLWKYILEHNPMSKYMKKVYMIR